MTDSFLILNAGSSSLKFSLFGDGDPPALLLHGQIEGLQTEPHFLARDTNGSTVGEHSWPVGTTVTHDNAIDFLFDWRRQYPQECSRIIAAGHRIVHGGTQFTKPVLVDDRILAGLESLIPLAPLHQPHNISAICAVEKHSPNLPQVACFDTSFHRTQPRVAQQFAISRELTAAGIQRYGFHGLSYEFVASRLPQVDPRAAAGRTVVAHLGNGASLCALQGGASIATTMSFTPLDGLAMGSRCGAIDPGVILYLLNQRGMDGPAIEHLLTYESGLLGVSGLSSDMRVLLNTEGTDTRAAEAIELFVYRISRDLGSMTAALGGLDALVFTGGIGENASTIRARVCADANWLGVDIDPTSNDCGASKISRPNSSVTTWVIPTNEEFVIAKYTQRLTK